MRVPPFIVIATAALLSCGHLHAQPFEALEQGLDIDAPGGVAAPNIGLAAAMRALHVPAVDVALIANGQLAWSHTFGTAPNNAIYQAASLSKLVTAVAGSGKSRALMKRGQNIGNQSYMLLFPETGQKPGKALWC